MDPKIFKSFVIYIITNNVMIFQLNIILFCIFVGRMKIQINKRKDRRDLHWSLGITHSRIKVK